MKRFLLLAPFGVVLVAAGLLGQSAATSRPATAPADRPVTTAKTQAGSLLRKWYAEGTAAGNVGDFYDNRDGGHSMLDLSLFPQLQRVVYSAEDHKARRDWAAQSVTLPNVTFGNSSTSAPPTEGGSNPRFYYTRPRGLALLYNHYTHNNLYIYPEHRDYDPGHNGVGGYGDLYPTNSPYLLISQGSSGSDQPFMRAAALTLAAFRPDTKRKLVESGLLMPAVQMILRMSNKQMAGAGDYLTGRAHPTVFDGGSVNEVRMVEMAHEMTADRIPPMVRLAVVREDAAVAGRQFFEAGLTEQHADTPCCIARVWRSCEYTRRLVVSAESSFDANRRPLAFHWAVLRGDADRVRITPQNAAGSVVEITLSYHDRCPVARGSSLESNRVDIGAFVHNGTYYSAPAFVTFLALDSEGRTYDDAGRLIEIGYGLGEVELLVTQWAAVLELFRAEADTPAARLLKKAFTPEQRAALVKTAEEYKPAYATLQAALAAARKGGSDPAVARKATDESAKAAADILGRSRPVLRGSARESVEKALLALANDPEFHAANAATIAALLKGAAEGPRNAVAAARKRLVGFGLLKDSPDAFELTPIRSAAAGPREVGKPREPAAASQPAPSSQPGGERFTRYEKFLVARYNAELLANLFFPGAVSASTRANFVDANLSAPKDWRDVYRYDGGGRRIGWTRYDGEQACEFNADGLGVLERDKLGRCTKARPVRYDRAVPRLAPGQRAPANWGPLKWTWGTEIIHYEYDGDADWKGHVKQRVGTERT